MHSMEASIIFDASVMYVYDTNAVIHNSRNAGEGLCNENISNKNILFSRVGLL